MSHKTFVNTVRVPSIEHAAEAIGQQGNKINMLQWQTKSLIITPNPGKDPVFIIKAPSAEALQECEAAILQSCANFDEIRLQKRDIIMPRESVVTTLRMYSNQIKIIIGRDGAVIKAIEELFKVYIKSPDRSTLNAPKQPIFVISGQQQNVNDCITFIKLVLFKSKHHIRLTKAEYQSIESLLITHENSIIDFESIQNDLSKEFLKIKSLRLTVIKNENPFNHSIKFYCPLCYNFMAKKAKAFPCGDFICCDKCIVPLYRKPNAKCTICMMKFDQFEILNHWQK